MARDLQPEEVLKALGKGQIAPFYLFYGPNEFDLERTLEKLKALLVPEASRDLNLEIFYGGESEPAEIVTRARTLPFLGKSRLLIVRRTEDFSAEGVGHFLPYLAVPVETTCLVFICPKPDLRKEFYRAIRSSGRAVRFDELKEGQIVPWIKRMAAEMGLKMSRDACLYLQEVVGSSLRDLYGEMEKLRIRYGEAALGAEEVRELAIHSRTYTIFQLMKTVSARKGAASVSVLNRFLEEEDKRQGPLRVIGMLNRQIRLLWQTKAIIERGGKRREVEERLGPARFSADEFISVTERWTAGELEEGLALLYEADGRLKSGSAPKLVLENLVLSLCGQGGSR